MSLQQFIIKDLLLFSILYFIAILFHELGHYIGIRMLKLKYKPFMTINEKDDAIFGFEFDSKSSVNTIVVSFSGIVAGLIILSMFFFINLLNPIMTLCNFVVRTILFYCSVSLYFWGCSYDIKLIAKHLEHLIELEKAKTRFKYGND
jgi:hypothetical protein